MLLTSIKKLAIQLNVDNKGIFPYKFVNDNNLNYIGSVSDF